MLQRILNYFRKDKRAEQYEHQPDDAIFTPKPVHPAMKAPIVRKPNGLVSSAPLTVTYGPIFYAHKDETLPKIPRGWKRADGKTRHVTRGKMDIMWGNGYIERDAKASSYMFAWEESNVPSLDIIAYRVRKPVKKVFSQKAKTSKQRKTVTVKKRVTK